MDLKLPVYFLIVFFCSTIHGQSTDNNLLDTSTWTVSSGSVSGFAQNGSTAENSREYGTDPYGNSSILWKATNDAANDADGGWNTSYQSIDHTKTYRFTVWLKKTNSNDGRTYFGTASYNGGVHSILKLNGTVNTNPYFWYGDLPQLNKWYLAVGYVHGSTYNSTENYGGIYDPVTGDKISNITDYKFAENAVNTRHRSYLYYDTNTSDRQYFFDPRLDLVDGNEPPIQELLDPSNTDTNLLDLSTWVVGTGSVSNFSQNGATSENNREWGENHVGDDVVLWKATNDATYDGDGGFNSSYVNINNNQSYRLSVWIKKTNSIDGRTYFGCRSLASGNSKILNLSGSENNNPYFWYGDLPKLDRWYLLVGFVHKSTYSSTVKLGRIYDGVTGEEVLTINDFKFKNDASNLMHRAYLFYDTNTFDRQFFWSPRIDLITGNEPTVTELLLTNEDSILILSYDVAGNQTQRFYCEEDGFCSPTAPTSRNVDESKEDIAELAPNPLEEELEDDVSDKQYTIYPNPTKGKVSIRLSGADYNLTNSISIYSTNGSLVQKLIISASTNQMELDISSMPSGVYFIHMHFTNGTVTTEQIIKR